MGEGNSPVPTPGEQGADAGQKLDRLADSARDSAARFAGQTESQIDSRRDRVASTLDRAAAGLEQRAGRLPGGEGVRKTARAAASRMGATAGYIRTHDVRTAGEDLKQMVRTNPGRSLIAAAFAGFFLGRLFRR